MAEIGVYPRERQGRQPLVVDVSLTLEPSDADDRLDRTVNYETILTAAEQVASAGHVDLVETFAERLAQACLVDPRVKIVRVRLEKPGALQPAALAAGVELEVHRADGV